MSGFRAPRRSRVRTGIAPISLAAIKTALDLSSKEAGTPPRQRRGARPRKDYQLKLY